MTTDTYHIDLDRLTVIATDVRGKQRDLNSAPEAEPCANKRELAEFVIELHGQGAYGDYIRNDLLNDTDYVLVDGALHEGEVVVNLMDEEIRERLHAEGEWPSLQAFVDAYCAAHAKKHVAEFVVS